jgi:hypothetical protein
MPATELRWIVDPPPPMNRPIMVLALRGLFDVAKVATGAVAHLLGTRVVETIATIDSDGFYDFTQERPQVWLDDVGDRQISWPTNDWNVVRFSDGPHDLVVLNGVEPHTRWRTYAEYVVEVALRCGCDVIVTVGAAAEAVPHTRTPGVFGSSTNDELARRLGLSRPQYQGPTGLFGVLHQMLERSRIPAISLRVPVPHYLVNAEHPKSTAALLRHLEHVLGVPTGHAHLAPDVERWQALHDSAVSTDRQAVTFVKMLEREFDRRTEAEIPSGDDLAAEFERFLRDQRGDAGPSA